MESDSEVDSGMEVASPPDVDIWSVLIHCDDEEKSRLYRLPIDTTITDLRARWAEDCGTLADPVIFMATDDQPLDDNMAIQEISESIPGRKLVTLLVEFSGLKVEIYTGNHGTSWCASATIPALMTQLPERLHRSIRQKLGITEDRLFRLRTAEMPLNYNLTLSEQGIDANSCLLVDLAFEIRVREPWSDTVEELLMYSSEDCDQLISDDRTLPQRLVYDRYGIDTYDEIIDALMPFGALQLNAFCLELHVVRDITILANDRFRERWVWPTDRISKVTPKCRPTGLSLMLDGRLLSTSCLMCETDLADFSLLHQNPLSVRVKHSDGRYRVVHVPRMGMVYDIREAVREKENDELFLLKRGKRFLGDNETVANDGPAVEVLIRSITVTITLSDRSVRWRTSEESLKFTDLINMLARKSLVKYHRLIGRTLCCDGCGRRITKAEEIFQAVPVACCKVRSLWLTEPTATPTSESGTQTGRRTSLYRSVGTELTTAEVSTQIRSGPLVHKSMETEPTTSDQALRARAVTQTEETASSVVSLEDLMKQQVVFVESIEKLKKVTEDQKMALDEARRTNQLQDELIEKLKTSLTNAMAERRDAVTDLEEAKERIKSLSRELHTAKQTIDQQKKEIDDMKALHDQAGNRKTTEIKELKENKKNLLQAGIRKEAHIKSLKADLFAAEVWEEELCRRVSSLEVETREQEKKIAELSSREAGAAGVSPDIAAAAVAQEPVDMRRSLFVWNLTRHRTGTHFSLEPAIPPPVTVGAVRAAVAAGMFVEPARLRLWRYSGTGPTGETFVELHDADDDRSEGSGPPQPFGDAAGNILGRHELRDVRQRPLSNDDEIFIVVPGQRSLIVVRPAVTSSRRMSMF